MAHHALFNDGQWEPGAGEPLRSVNPANGETVWEELSADAAQVDRAVSAARSAAASWAETPLEERVTLLNAFAEQLKQHRTELAECISREVGKPLWESATEVDAMAQKVPLSVRAYEERRRPVTSESAGVTSATRFKPHGMVAVFGPFNFPGHLPNGHIVPALLAGNTVVFKPSEHAPLVAERTVRLWESAGVPRGVVNLVQGGREVGQRLSTHPQLDGLFFTGSAAVGLALRTALASHPDKILALEMGGNNPLIVHDVADAEAAAYLAAQSAFLTAGQRCTCARRLIVPRGVAGDAFIDALVTVTKSIRVGPYTDLPEPFMGPVISADVGRKLLDTQTQFVRRGATSLVEMRPIGANPALLSPGLVDVTAVADRTDEEVFGPLLQVIRVDDFDAALTEANRTAYGLSAGLLSDRRDLYERFYRATRAGVVTWNRPTTGASGALPFGGVGLSGNHRPSGYYAADYCSYPIASTESPRVERPPKLPPGIGP